MVKSRYIGDGHPTFNRNPYNGYINPYYWVDDHPLLYGNNGSLDPGTYKRIIFTPEKTPTFIIHPSCCFVTFGMCIIHVSNSYTKGAEKKVDEGTSRPRFLGPQMMKGPGLPHESKNKNGKLMVGTWN